MENSCQSKTNKINLKVGLIKFSYVCSKNIKYFNTVVGIKNKEDFFLL